MMGEIMMAFGKADFGESAIAAFAGQKQSRDPRGISLKSQSKHIEHKRDMLLEIGRDARGGIHSRVCHRNAFSSFDSLFNLPNASEILVQVLPIPAIQFPFNCSVIFHHEIED